jgi:LuxR family maltose regulon positive regulatory protein
VACGERKGPAYDGFSSPAAGAACLRSMYRGLIGDIGGSLAAAVESLEDGGPGVPWDAVSLNMSGSSRYWLGEAERGRAEIEQALVRARELGFHPTVISCLGLLAAIHLLEGEPGPARRLAGQAIELTEANGLAEGWSSAASHTVLGGALLAEGRREEGLPELERGLELARRGSGVLGVAHGLIGLARAIPPADGRPLLAEARELLAGCPDPGPLTLGRLAGAERRAGAAPRTAAASGESFSDRELEVLRMLAGPLSQREIGSELFISFNTVKSHTKAIYRKLGAADRNHALARARELGLL